MKKNNLIDMESKKFRNIVLCAAPLVFMVLFHMLKINDEANTKFFMEISLAAVTAYGGYLAYKGKLDAAKAVTLIMIAGVIMRTGYTIYTDVFTRNHDIYGDAGHLAYLSRAVHGVLPESNEYEFYHPPLFYMISAVFVKAAMIVTRGDDLNNYLYMSQIVSCIGSCVMLITLSEIMDELKVKKYIQIIPVALTAFYPAQIFAAGRLNNDMLVTTFTMLAFYFTIKWHKEQKIGFIIGIAATIGCAMMTKISGALTAFITGPVMLYHLIICIKSGDREKIKDIIVQFAVFAVIVFPLGLWYPIRNYILFDQPLNYVLKGPTTAWTYTGDRSFFERWIDIPFARFITKPYMDMAADAGVWLALIVTGVHGEFTWEGLSSVLEWGIEYIHILLIIIAVLAVVIETVKDKALSKFQRYPVLAVWAIVGISYISFNISHPAICTADFRYLLTGQPAAAVLIGYFVDYCFRNRDKMLYRTLFGVGGAVVSLFCIMSIIKIL